MNEVIEQIYRTRQTLGRSGPRAVDDTAIDRQEGEFLYRTIRERAGTLKTLEVGCAYGLSSLFICEALRGKPEGRHTIIDPGQTRTFDGAGILALERAGLENFSLLEGPSEIELPVLLKSRERFDLVFVDGRHTFDQALLDCFYATKLLSVGGVLIIDDADWPALRRVVSHFATYPCYTVIGGTGLSRQRSLPERLARWVAQRFPERMGRRYLSPRIADRLWTRTEYGMVALEKRAEDARRWDWHEEF